ncbi:MAG: CarD family transcriptional regulator [Clostridiales bacterium]|nr:CarD family transcriptional regulator [Clostridiales bacterium]
MFKVGERVCYPMHGVGEIEGIEERTVLGETASYYVLRFLIGRMTAFVPVKRAESVGLRYVIGADECERVLAFLREEPPEESGNWNQRYRENYEKLRRGSVYEVAEVVRCLVRREAEKGLSSGERKMLAGARQVLVSELSAASGRSAEELFRSVGG